MTWRSWRLVPVALLAWAAAFASTHAPAAAVPVALASGLAAVAAVAVLHRAVRRDGRGARAAAVVAVCLAVCAGVSAHVALAEPGRSGLARIADAEGRALVVTARVTGAVSAGPTGEVWFDATTQSITVGEQTMTAAAPMRVGVAATDAESLRTADLGALVEVRGRALPVEAGDRAALVVRSHGDIRVIEPPSGILGVLADMRDALAASAAGLPRPGGALVPGLATGDTSAVDAPLDEAMKASSLSHLTAVSGANCAIVLGMCFGAAAMCGAGRRTRVALGLSGLALFVLLVTPEPSVVRAAAMAAIAMLALLLGRRGAGLATLALAVVVLLMLDPWLSSSLGFALSAAATAALLVLARPLAAGLARVMPRSLAFVIAVPLSAQLACAPLLVLIDPRVPLLGVVANLLAAPAAPVATIAGFLASLAAPLPVVQDGLVGVAWVPASWIAGVAEGVASLPAQQVPWLEGAAGAALLALLCAAIVVAITAPRWIDRRARIVRGAAILTSALVLGTTLAHTALSSVMSAWTVPSGSWRIAVCDVGQGDAVLLRSERAVALIDTGPDPVLLGRCLERFGVARIDLLVLTHFDADHAGGAAAVAGRVDAVLHGPPPSAGERILALLEAQGARVTPVAAGARGQLGGARWRVLWPSAAEETPGNDASVVIEVDGGGIPHAVLLGDLSAEPQARVRALVTDVDVVKVAHHGSADQDPGLYDALSAEIALVPVGADNDYGHPRASLLDILRATGATVARSDQDGTIAVWREDGVLRLWRERGVGGAQ